MSYTISITRNVVSSNDELAWDELEQICEREESATDHARDFLIFIESLKLRFPCICDLSDDEIEAKGVWTDGPLSNNAGADLIILGVIFSHVHEVVPFVISMASKVGFVVFDPQEGKIYRPLPIPEQTPPTRPSFWKRLLSKSAFKDSL